MILPFGLNSLLGILALLLSRPFLTSLTEELTTETLSNTTKCSTPTAATFNHSSGKPNPKEKMYSRAFHMMKDMLRTEICPVCDGAHSLYQYTVFGAWNVSCRHGFVCRKHLCFNCLGSNHSIESCNSRCTCHECKYKHHTLLHCSAIKLLTFRYYRYSEVCSFSVSRRRSICYWSSCPD